MARTSLLNRGVCAGAISALILAAAPVAADSLAAIPPAGDERARVAFLEFAAAWMAKLENGSSTQAPRGMLALGVLNTEQWLQRRFDQLARGRGDPVTALREAGRL